MGLVVFEEKFLSYTDHGSCIYNAPCIKYLGIRILLIIVYK